jgi:hypothetical protein
MAYLTITRFSGDPDHLLDTYRRSAKKMAEVGRDHCLILHTAAKTEDGVLVVNLWPSEDASEAAARDERRLTVLQESGLSPDQMQREHYEVEDYDLFD